MIQLQLENTEKHTWCKLALCNSQCDQTLEIKCSTIFRIVPEK